MVERGKQYCRKVTVIPDPRGFLLATYGAGSTEGDATDEGDREFMSGGSQTRKRRRERELLEWGETKESTIRWKKGKKGCVVQYSARKYQSKKKRRESVRK